jgi:hypothetical protein
MRLILAVVVLMASATATTAEDRSTTVTILRPVTTSQAIDVAERLGQIEYAVNKCGFQPHLPTIQVLMTKQLEGGAGGNMSMQSEILDRRVKLGGLATVCQSLSTMFGPTGSVIKGALLAK